MEKHSFGGSWTEEKLARVVKYLQAYTNIFHTNKFAKRYATVYVDAFAGTGYRSVDHIQMDEEGLFPMQKEPETEEFLKGSAAIALEVNPPFDRYIFVEKDAKRIQCLRELVEGSAIPLDKVEVIQEDANVFIKQWCSKTDWHRTRAVMFLDPYGMQVEWQTLEIIAATKAIDLWILFPLGVGVNRLLTKKEIPPKGWSDILTKMFGTDKWKKTFYRTETTETLFGEETNEFKQADFKSISDYFISRLRIIFAKVAPNPLFLLNSRNNPLFLLCFAAGNPRGSSTAVKIAQYLLKS